jgi:sec-independent protein translocase protein TatC
VAQDTSAAQDANESDAKAKRRKRDPEGRMSLGEHLTELRNRLLWCAGALVITMVVGWIIYPWVFDFLQTPFEIAKANGLKATINFGTVGSGLSIQLQTSAYVGIILAMPMFLYQVWMFVMPGLHTNERKYMYGFFGSAIPLFVLGCFFGYLALNRAVPILLSFTPKNDQVDQIVLYQDYLKLLVSTILAFGIAFIMPVVLVILNLMDILRAKTMLKAWRWVVFLVIAFTAVMVPTPDPVTLLSMAAPMLILFFAAVGISALNDRRRGRREDADLDDDQASSIDESPEKVDGPSSIDEDDE